MGLLKAFAWEVQSAKNGKPPRRQLRQDFYFTTRGKFSWRLWRLAG
jgi:hypothetical protein